jgi:two-component system OmpR family response regulator
MSAIEDVVTLAWSTDSADLAQLVADGRPRIFLVPESAAPPEIDHDLVDWIRMPADDRDLQARRRTLARRAAAGHHRFRLDQFGRLHYGDLWVMIHSSVERGLLASMLPRIGQVSSFEELFGAGWSNGNASANALRVQMTRMNRRIAPLGLAVRGVRNVGYVLDDVRFAPPSLRVN